ncbi:hypothetical protein NJ17_004353 [Salmonella enterica subsp. enterica]|nr:hypothetical protein [Salmonella enterica subsp. enterica]
MLYVIDENIEYRPRLNLLTSKIEPYNSVKLPTPANQCLLLLVQKSPEVVRQEDFIKVVWRNNNMEIPLNTLYQNISILRRSLKKVSANDKKIISTKSRQGFCISGICIYQFEEDDGLIENVNKKEQTDFFSKPEHNILIGAFLLRLKNIIKNYILNDTTVYFYIVIAILIASNKITDNFNTDQNFYENYLFEKKHDGCIVKYNENDDTDLLETLLHKLNPKLNCKSYPFIYVPTNTEYPAYTILTCKKEYDKKKGNHCINQYIYIGDDILK